MATARQGKLAQSVSLPPQSLIETAVRQIQQLGALEEVSHLFPDGLSPAAKGEPLTGLSASVAALTVYAITLLEQASVT